MDIPRGKHSFRGHKAPISSNSRYEANNFNISPNRGIFLQSKIQKNSLKWRKEHHQKAAQKSRFPYNKGDSNYKKVTKTAEDKEEEERKKKLSDTANKLLTKIKTWNAEKTEDESNLQLNLHQEVGESVCKVNEKEISLQEKPKRIAHSKQTKLVKNRTKKSTYQLSKTKPIYDVNKETVKNFQNRIQHKLIEEIMQMPKENLQNVLNDPKINPRMELKMSRLVRENKLLIAQKLREIAESKMNSADSCKSSQLLVDIDKLIDPVIETDLSVLPYELIKQMENIFQVQFDHSSNAPQLELSDSGAIKGDDILIENNNSVSNVKVENNEDLSFYECSTDEDENNDGFKFSNQPEENLDVLEKISSNVETEELNEKNDTIPSSFESVPETHDNVNSAPVKITFQPNVVEKTISVTEDSVQNFSPKDIQCASTQTSNDLENPSALISSESSTSNTLYGVPLPVETTNSNLLSLLTEMNSIQTLTNKLNERRLMIFLQLAQINPEGNFICDDIIRRGFVESLSNGSLSLVDSLRQFLRNKCRDGNNRSGQKSEKKKKNKQKNR